MSAFTEDQIAELKAIFGSQPAPAAEPAPETDRTSVVGKPDVDPESGPLFYVHLANGEVVESYDSSSSHIDGQLVIGRYQKGE